MHERINSESFVDCFWRMSEKIFHREFNLTSSNKLELSACHQLSLTEQDTYLKLQEFKFLLNTVKRKVNSVVTHHSLNQWHAHTAFMHPAGGFPEQIKQLRRDLSEKTVTQAFCKFLELDCKYALSKGANWEGTFRSLHLCEAPGAFVLALNESLSIQGRKLSDWEWRLNSLNPYNTLNDPTKMLFDAFGLIKQNPEKMVLGEDGTGNILSFSDEYISSLGKFHLITADGSFDCTEHPDEQETAVFPLIHCEVQIALRCLAEGGNFLLKIFTIFEPETVQLILRLINKFRRILCVKPPSSKAGNSEVYLICLCFLGHDGPETDNTFEIQRDMKIIEDCACYFAKLQMDFIELNLKSFKQLSPSDHAALSIAKLNVAKKLINEVYEKIIANM